MKPLNPLKDPYDLLVVDDNAKNLQLLVGLLRDQGYNVRGALSGELALRGVKQQPPDLILLDIKMPEMDGYSVCTRLKQNDDTKKIPVIFISALDESHEIARGFEVGGVDYITKPFNSKEVLARVKTHLELYRIQEHLEELVLERTAELRISEEKYREVVEELPVLVGSFLADGTITFVNSAYCKYFDKKAEELIGSSFLTLIPQEKKEDVMASFLALTPAAPSMSYENQVLAPNGTVRWQRWINHALYDANGKRRLFQAIGEDITDRKQAEEELKILKGILPLCSYCKKIRNDEGHWEEVDTYIHKHSAADISHGICPECAEKHFSEYFEKGEMQKDEN